MADSNFWKILNYLSEKEQFTYIQDVYIFVVGFICFTSPKQEDLLIDYSTRVVISTKETLVSELHDCSRRAWERELPPRAKSRQKALVKNRPLRFQMRSLKKMIPATNAPWQQPAHSVLSQNTRFHSAQNLLLWRQRNLIPKIIWLDWIWVRMQEINSNMLYISLLLGCFCIFTLYIVLGNMDILGIKRTIISFSSRKWCFKAPLAKLCH